MDTTRHPYHQYMNRDDRPSKPGSKEIPQGDADCLKGLTFVLTGVLESMDKAKTEEVITARGGRVTTAISGRTNYIVAGRESGPAKMAKAKEMNIPVLTEDGLLDMIRNRSTNKNIQ